ncbi:hypothetical protein AAFF_G00001330 [Aldrovandia affinis]|uniref:Uncharacterized protein n=1 Tax=Aldrovandia affinis TaxID=143900 RepID=A0AAD7X4K1_9TELE|nr:hypothetical protein AAFF_G00001330 [Aldrovandia affinis]
MAACAPVAITPHVQKDGFVNEANQSRRAAAASASTPNGKDPLARIGISYGELHVSAVLASPDSGLSMISDFLLKQSLCPRLEVQHLGQLLPCLEKALSAGKADCMPRLSMQAPKAL